MRVSCIIPTYRQMDYLLETIKSVLVQGYPNIELIIADDASENFDELEIQKFIQNNKKENLKNFYIIQHEKNVGTVRNMNDALKKCSGEIIMPIASDDVFYNTDVIEKVVNRFKSEQCEVMSCSRQLCSNDMKHRIRLMPHPAYHNRLKKMNTAEKQFLSMAVGRSFELASGAAMYYKASYIMKNEYYDERYTLWEDGPFIAKTTRNGIKICMAYDIISILYRDGGISTSKNKEIPPKIYNDYCNIIKYEYLDYLDRFGVLNRRILKGKFVIQNNRDKITFGIIFKYPEAVINRYLIKISKGIDRLLYKVKKGKEQWF